MRLFCPSRAAVPSAFLLGWDRVGVFLWSVCVWVSVSLFFAPVVVQHMFEVIWLQWQVSMPLMSWGELGVYWPSPVIAANCFRTFQQAVDGIKISNLVMSNAVSFFGLGILRHVGVQQPAPSPKG